MTVTLTQTEWVLAAAMAAIRSGTNRTVGVTDRKMGGQSAYATDVDGAGAEVAFARVYGLYPDLSMGSRKGSADFVVKGKTVDVKQTSHPNGQLLARPDCGERFDVYVLVVGTMPHFTIAGWASADELFADENLTDLGHGPTYALPQAKLNPMKEQ